ncbi:arginyl-tRNA synthetase [Mycena alexandri]|uniref:arginine--tRNA ligase n=1 Tax=Mycena alexandri TaxID=1745969 RepID=A0AAD6SI69_9AGAR|nr:arginyl-tRNA synthetase [Mycena alexandri]
MSTRSDQGYFIDQCRETIAKSVSACLQIDFEAAYAGVDLGKKGLDFTIAIPRFRLQKKPQELAERVRTHFLDNPDPIIDQVIADGAFVHFMIRTQILLRSALDQVFEMSRPTGPFPHGRYGANDSGAGKKVVVEYSSPNIAKPFHAGHLRSTIIGTFLSNLYAANGWDVVRVNYLGDWGVQFGLLAVGFRKYGSEAKLSENAIMHLFEIYVKINADKDAESAAGQSGTLNEARTIFKAMEDGAPNALALWRRFRDLSVDAYKEVYSRLNIEFDEYIGESLVTSSNIDSAMEELRSKGLLAAKHKWESQPGRNYKMPPPTGDKGNPLKDDNPAWAVDLHKFKLDKPVVQKPDGTTIYMVRDIAGAIQRFERYQFDKMIYVVGDQQDLHCAQLFKILELMDAPFANRLEHINFGKVKGMSTRKGDVKFLEEILDMAQESMLSQMQTNVEKFNNVEDPSSASDQIGMTCVKIQDMLAKRINSYAFDPDRMTSFEGDTGAYLQYAHVRLCSVKRKVASELSLPQNSTLVDTDLLVEPKAREIAYVLACYPEVVRMAFKVSEPSTIVSYCFKLSHVISSALENLIVKGQGKQVAEARLLLFMCAKLVLASAMRLLSLNPLERM